MRLFLGEKRFLYTNACDRMATATEQQRRPPTKDRTINMRRFVGTTPTMIHSYIGGGPFSSLLEEPDIFIQ